MRGMSKRSAEAKREQERDRGVRGEEAECRK